MDFIDFLSESDSKRIIELASEVQQASMKEEELIKKSKELVLKGDEVNRNKQELINKCNNYVVIDEGKPVNTINNSIDSEEFIYLMNKITEYKNEQKDIQEESRLLNKELEEINNTRKSIKNKIDELLSKTAKTDLGTKVDNIGVIHIIGLDVPEDKEKISKDLCEIINCSISLVNEICNSYNSNVSIKSAKTSEDEFAKLKKYVSNYNDNKEATYENQLEILNKVLNEEVKIEEPIKEEIKDEEPIKETIEDTNPVNDNIIETNLSEENKQEETIEVKKDPVTLEVIEEEKTIVNMDNITNTNIPKEDEKPILESIVGFDEPKEEQNVVKKDPVTLEVISEIKPEEKTEASSTDNIVSLSEIIGEPEPKVDDSTKTLYMLIGDKVTPNQIARATKDKLYNKISLIFKDSYPETVVQRVSSLNEVNTNNGFNIENFVTNKAA